MSDSIFREVNEELRNERIRALWRRYGLYVIGGAVAIVLIVAANEAWKWWQGSTAGRSSDLLQTALDNIADGDIAGAEAALDATIAEGSGRYPVIAQFKAASLLASKGQVTEAVAAYDGLAGTADLPLLRELAQLYAALLLVDAGDVAGVTSRVSGLVSPDHPLRNSAREALGLANYQAGDAIAALGFFEAIVSDPLTARDIGSRASVYIAQLASEGVALPGPADNATAPATEAAPATP